MSGFPDQLDPGRHRDLEGRQHAPWVRRGILAVLLALPVIALLNVFGQHPAVTQVSAAQALVRVQAPSRIRGGDIFQVRVDVVARRAIAKPVLVFGSGWWEQMTLNGVVPQPATESARDGRVAFAFGGLPAGRRLTAWLYFQVNPTNVGRRRERLELDDGRTPIARLDRSLVVFP